MKKVGIILRADYGGLSRISEDFYHFLKPDKSLVVDTQYVPLRREMFVGPDVTIAKHTPPYYVSTEDLQSWIEGLDVVLTFETPYNWELFNLTKRAGIRSVLMVDYEYFPGLLPSRPDVLWMPVRWFLDELKKDGIPVQFIPMPVDRLRFKFKQKKVAKTFLTVLGHHHMLNEDRNGIRTLFDAIPLVKNKDIRFLFRSIQPLPKINDPRVEIDVSTKKRPEGNWSKGDVLIYPRRYAGMSLPMNEALSCGMPVLMSNMSPQNNILPPHWLLPTKICPYHLGRNVDIGTVSPADLAAKIDEWAMKDISKESLLADQIANEISWGRLLPALQGLLHG